MINSSLSQDETILQNLIPAVLGEISGEQQPLVNARQLHQFLEVGRDFSNWIKARIFDYDFQENQDYIIFANSGENSNVGRPTIEYRLTLDMAKELSMVERNEKGRMARRYFIECEKQLYQQPQNDPLASITQNMQKMADGMQVLAQASTTTMAKLDHTERYINLLELNQKGTVKITRELAEEVKRYRAMGYSLSEIARHLRISKTSASLIVNDKYPFAELPSDQSVNRMIETCRQLVEKKEI